MVACSNDEPPASPSRSVKDHPAPLGALTEIFDRRNIAVGIDSAGQVVLARPNTVLARVAEDVERRSLADYVPSTTRRSRADSQRQGAACRSSRSRPRRRACVGQQREPLDVGTRPGGDHAILPASIHQLTSELNHVFFGEQAVKGNPLGAPATWAGEMAFLGNVVDDQARRQRRKPQGDAVDGRAGRGATVPARRLDIEGRRRPQILVLDTGLRTVVENGDAATGARLPRVLQRARPLEDAEPEGTGRSPSTTRTSRTTTARGHSTSKAVTARSSPASSPSCAPMPRSTSSGVLSSFGDGDVAEVIAGLHAGLAAQPDQPIDIVVMSFGAFFADDDPGLFGESLRKLLGDKVLGVAAAGNQATCRPYFPAALHEVNGVGAVSAAGRAWFSNFGGWVDACAPGVDVVSTFFNFSEDLALFPDARRPQAAGVQRVGELERDELLGAEGRRRARPGDVPQPQR